MQIKAFKELLEKYQDFDTSPGSERVEKVEARLKQEAAYYYFICMDGEKVGAIRVGDKKKEGENKRISPQGKGIAQET